MASLTDRVSQTVGRHFVALSCVQRPPSSDEERVFVFSGFLVTAGNQWFYVTAGHILKDIRAALVAGYVFDRWRLDDQTAGNAFKGMAVPYVFDADDWLVIEDEAQGLDYAAVPLREMCRLALAAGGAAPIASNAWGDHVTDHDHWVLVGIPKESVYYDGETKIAARVVMAPVSPTDEPAAAGSKTANQFYAKLQDDPNGAVADVNGMSGGPIFGLKNVAGRWMYQVIGVQSGWYESSRVTAACPFSSFGMALEEAVASAKASIG
jgi:hypothetical protein